MKSKWSENELKESSGDEPAAAVPSAGTSLQRGLVPELALADYRNFDWKRFWEGWRRVGAGEVAAVGFLAGRSSCD
jgi:hypothetical protein